MSEFRRFGRVVAVLVAVVVFAGCDWAAFGFGPDGTYFNPSEPALTDSSVRNLSVAWSTPCACHDGRPLVAAGVVYTIDGYLGSGPFSLTLRALVASDGVPKWSAALGSAMSGAALDAVGNGLVYVTVDPVSGPNQLVAFDAQTGAPRWQVTPPAPASGPAGLSRTIVDGPLAFVAATASDASEVSAVDTQGRVVWSGSPGGGLFFPGPGLTADPGRTVYIPTVLRLTATPGGFVLLTGYSESDGTVRSKVVVPTSFPLVSIAFAGGLVYGTGYTDFGHLPGLGAFALHPDTGTLAWSADMFELAVASNAVITSDARRGQLTARNPTTGAPLWTVDDNAGSAAVAGGLVFLGTGNVRRLSDGALMTTITTGGLTPSEGRVYLSAGGRLTALAPTGP